MSKISTKLVISNRLSTQWDKVAILGGLLAILFLTNNPDSGSGQVIPIVGRAGTKTVTSANTVLNQYAVLSFDASQGDVNLSVTNISDLSDGTDLGTDDLIMIIQMQGASIKVADDISFGEITNYHNAGNYEFAYVAGASGNQITLSCGLIHDYSASGHAQIIRVPQYTTLTIEPDASVVAPQWDGSTGGIIAIVAEEVIEIDGSLSVAGKGFRGGQVDNNTSWNRLEYYTASNSYSASKGESVVGYEAEYDVLGARYGRGAIANGGGGGNAHNAGGGGGANGNSGDTWTGQGNMCQSCTGASAWQLDSGYIDNGNAYTTSSGGGRGGYTYGSSNGDALTNGPAHSSWGGDKRRNLGGLGGRPVNNDPSSKLFLGGGGGAGDGNNNAANDGANGGGLIFLLADKVTGSGNIQASGADAEPTKSGHNDGPGGGGGGGTIVIKANQVSGVTLYADGGNGGNQLITNNESEGPGGGGGGGFISLPQNSLVTASVNGGEGGTSTSQSVTEFPKNGSTEGANGTENTVTAYIPFCASFDHDKDGIGDETDLDDDNDGIPDWEEIGCTVEEFGTESCPDPASKTANGVPLYLDASSCSGGTLVNGVCPEYDTDGDGIPDFLDRDSDNDGVPDIIEALGVDTDGNGEVDGFTRCDATYTISLAITDDLGNQSSLNEVISLGTNPPAADLSISPSPISSSLTLSFDGSASSDNGSIVSYSWDFGDGNSTTGSTANHTYNAEGQYTVVLTVTDDQGLIDTYSQFVYVYDGDPCRLSTGSIYREYWSNISGTSVSSLTEASYFPDNPSGTSSLTTFQGPTNFGSNYGTRVRGYLIPPSSGDYYFTITGDDGVSLYLSSDMDEANKSEISAFSGWTNATEFDKYSTQKSAAISLVEGEAYYIELLHKEGGGGDHFAVYWERPDDATRTIIDGQYLAPWGGGCINFPPIADIQVSTTSGEHPLNVVMDASNSIDSDGSIVSYQWQMGDGTTANTVATSHTYHADLCLTDSDNDGWYDAYDSYDNGGTGYAGGTSLVPPDTDNDGKKDFQDIDADNDGILDIIESGGGDSDEDGDGRIGFHGTALADVDSDGFADTFDPDDDTGGNTTGTALITTSTASSGNVPDSYNSGDADADGKPNYQDIDSDADGILDWLEAQPSGDSSPIDGLTMPIGLDLDQDGLDDAFDIMNELNGIIMTGEAISPINSDSDDLPDYLDPDSDNDGTPDNVEGHDNNQDNVADSQPTSADVDTDGLDDGYDPYTDRNSAGYKTENSTSSSQSVQNSDGKSERDWREPTAKHFPVEWLSFTVELENGNGQLKWATASELNSFYFEIERSADGNSFEALDQVQAAGTTTETTHYDFLDQGVNQLGVPAVLYRLRQVDLDGQFEYSNLLELKLDGTPVDVSLSLYPNPAKTATTLRFTTPKAGDWQLQVVNVSGQMMKQQTVSSMGGMQEIPLNVEGWTPGYYVVRLTDGVQNLAQKLQVR